MGKGIRGNSHAVWFHTAPPNTAWAKSPSKCYNDMPIMMSSDIQHRTISQDIFQIAIETLNIPVHLHMVSELVLLGQNSKTVLKGLLVLLRHIWITQHTPCLVCKLQYLSRSLDSKDSLIELLMKLQKKLPKVKNIPECPIFYQAIFWAFRI